MATEHIIGFSGGPNFLGAVPVVPGLSPLYFHDSAAVVVRDGVPVYALEEERVSRVKHTNAFPVGALRACLNYTGLTPAGIDGFAFFFDEHFYDVDLSAECAAFRCPSSRSVREMLVGHLSETFGCDCAAVPLHFVRHHDAHMEAARRGAGFEDCMVFVIDGNGEHESISVYSVAGGTPTLLRSYPVANSLGHFYRLSTKLLGFGSFDEYKVMGLAPYGDPELFRKYFSPLYRGGGGELELDVRALTELAWRLRVTQPAPRPERSAAHRNFAAAVQHFLEEILIDLVGWWQRETGHMRLAIAGGVGHNCAANGRLARLNLFESIYVHPASHDAGAALGAALKIARPPSPPVTRSFFVPFLGPGVPPDEIADTLTPWAGILQYRRLDDVFGPGAQYLADGKIVAWVRGRAEFGPRALGSRCILADPRPRGNRERINLAIKGREGFRPFAPAVLSEYLPHYFELPRTALNFADMVFVLGVKPEYRSELGAVTHVDGTARVQAVDPDTNLDFWSLIEAFRQRTSCALLLNTSFNNSHEPIVLTAADAVRAFLTTDLDVLIIEDWIIEKAALVTAHDRLLSLTLSIPLGVEIRAARLGANWNWTMQRSDQGSPCALSDPLAAALLGVRGPVSVSDLLPDGASELREAHGPSEIFNLWKRRLIDLRPR